MGDGLEIHDTSKAFQIVGIDKQTGASKVSWQDASGQIHEVSILTKKQMDGLKERYPNLIDQNDWRSAGFGEQKVFYHESAHQIPSRERICFLKVFMKSLETAEKVKISQGIVKREFGDQSEIINRLAQENLSTMVSVAKMQGKSKIEHWHGKTFYKIKCRIDENHNVVVSVKQGIGAGGFKKVQKIVDIGVPEHLALNSIAYAYSSPKEKRILDKQGMQEFRREADMMKKFVSSGVRNVVKFFGVKEKAGRFQGFFSEICNAGDARKISGNPFFRTRQPWTALKMTLQVGHQVAGAVADLHALNRPDLGLQSVCHMDIKPDNILLITTPEGRLEGRLADFGLAANQGESVPTFTWKYADIETRTAFCEGRSKANPANDVWMLGATLFEMTHGAHNNPLKDWDRFKDRNPAEAYKEWYSSVQNLHAQLDVRKNPIDAVLAKIFVPAESRLTAQQVEQELGSILAKIDASPHAYPGFEGMFGSQSAPSPTSSSSPQPVQKRRKKEISVRMKLQKKLAEIREVGKWLKGSLRRLKIK